ncbi:MAG: hypothetical protein LBR22_00895 [Desulfovibrio sp.]|nr:hypothetical protein [Desulfovibrio sp.]
MFLKVSSRTLALSQTCVCDRRERKPLSQSIHACPERGFTAQRDLLSASLLLAAAASRADKTAKAKAARPSALGFGRGNAVRCRRCSSALADIASVSVPRRSSPYAL